MTHNRYAIAHHAKFGKPLSLTAEMMEAMKVMSQASCRSYLSALFSSYAAKWKRERIRTYAIDMVASANGSPTICPGKVQCVLCFPFETAHYQS